MMTWASRRVRKHSTLRHSSRNLALKDSLVPFCQGLARIDDGGLDASVGQPLQDGIAHELGTADGTQVDRGTMQTHQSRQDIYHARRADTAGHVDGQSL